DLDGQPVDIRDADTMPARGSSSPRPGKPYGGGHFNGGRGGGHFGGGRPPYRKYDRRPDRR
ncbi:MAG: hypothetical protein IJK04_04105, partial [Kiritimatiellae bacterium]|nr:hypothetical protein [Kiritimatiellia bacterium]